MPTLWTQQEWNAGWPCRRCLVHIWNIAPGTLDRIMDRDYSKVYPATSTKRAATAELQEDSYDISKHLPSTGVDAAAKDAYSRQPARRDEPTPNDDDFGRVPRRGPPTAPSLTISIHTQARRGGSGCPRALP
eukprot:6977133-Pyramimonas_sp.AAC.1